MVKVVCYYWGVMHPIFVLRLSIIGILLSTFLRIGTYNKIIE